MTRINGTSVSAFDRVELWYLNEAGIAAASNTTFTLTYGNGVPVSQHFSAVTFKNIDQAATILQHAVAEYMAVHIVDALEAVEIDDADRETQRFARVRLRLHLQLGG